MWWKHDTSESCQCLEGDPLVILNCKSVTFSQFIVSGPSRWHPASSGFLPSDASGHHASTTVVSWHHNFPCFGHCLLDTGLLWYYPQDHLASRERSGLRNISIGCRVWTLRSIRHGSWSSFSVRVLQCYYRRSQWLINSGKKNIRDASKVGNGI